MKKVIELALKSGDITLQGVINLVNCLNDIQQERAVMLLTENNDIPNEVNILAKGISFNSEGDVDCEYTCIGYNYLTEHVIVKKHYVKRQHDDFETDVTIYAWKGYRKNYLDNEMKKRKELLKELEEQNAAE